MNAEREPIDSYLRRLFVGATLTILVLAGLAALLPQRFAAELFERKAKLLLESWGERIADRAQLFAQAAREDEGDFVRLSSVRSRSSGRTFQLSILAEAEPRPLAGAWADGGMRGFEIDDYLIEGSLPQRAVGDQLYLDGSPHLIALLPGEGDGRAALRIGPSLSRDFELVQVTDWKLAVVRAGNVAYSSDDSLRTGTSPADPQFLDMLQSVAADETSRLVRLGVLGNRLCVVAPLKDFDRWNVIGSAILIRTAPPAHEDFSATALALFSVLLAAVPFALAGLGRLPERGPRRWHPVAGLAAVVAGAAASAAALLLLGGRLSDELAAESAGAFNALARGGEAEWISSASFFGSLDLLGVLALEAAVLATSLLFLAAVRHFRHLATIRQAVAAAGFLAPATAYLAVFVVGPVLFALFISFHRWEILNPVKTFVGLDNFAELFGDPLFWGSLFNTLVYSLHVPFTMAISLALALALQRKVRGVTILRTLFFLPYITSFVAISTVWQWLYNTEFGLLNYLLSLVGLGPVNWLSDPLTALPSVMIMSVWLQLGYQMIIFIAGLQGIPQHLYEAAAIDGAGPWQRFRRITLPLLRPTIFFILVTSVINSFQVFTYVYVMTQGGPLHSTEVLVYHIYKNAWEYFRMGYASALSWVLFLLILVVTIAQFAYFRKRIEAVTA